MYAGEPRQCMLSLYSDDEEKIKKINFRYKGLGFTLMQYGVEIIFEFVF